MESRKPSLPKIELRKMTMLPEQKQPPAGLLYLPDFVDEPYESDLLETIDRQPWCADLRRRVQHYGYRYDYQSRTIRPEMYLGTLPPWLEILAYRLVSQSLFPVAPDQVIVNEYLPGQGIAAHVDCVPCFSETIASLSLGSSCVMYFTNNVTHQKVPWFLGQRSLVVLAGEARYDWKHGIAPRRSDDFNGRRALRGRRVSVTFRKVI